MAYIDWVVLESDTVKILIHEYFGPRRLPKDVDEVEQDLYSLDTPISGTGSLVWHFFLSAKGMVYREGDAGTRSGFLRTQWNVQVGGVGSPVYGFGMFCCSSQTNLVGGSGNCYFVSIQRIQEEYKVFIYKSSVGVGGSLEIPPLIVLGSSEDLQWSELQNFTTEFRWFSYNGGVILSYSQGSNPDYTDLALVLEVNDTNSPLIVASNQGFWAENVTSSSLALFMDSTTGRQALASGIV